MKTKTKEQLNQAFRDRQVANSQRRIAAQNAVNDALDTLSQAQGALDAAQWEVDSNNSCPAEKYGKRGYHGFAKYR